MSALNRLLSAAAWATFDHIAGLFLSLTPNPDVKKYYVNVKQVWLTDQNRRLTVHRKPLSPELIKFYLFFFINETHKPSSEICKISKIDLINNYTALHN